jgi:hypothetical protein
LNTLCLSLVVVGLIPSGSWVQILSTLMNEKSTLSGAFFLR